MTARLEEGGGFCDESAYDAEAVAAGREREARLMLAHLSLESGEVFFCDVRRVRGDEVETRSFMFIFTLAFMLTFTHALLLAAAERVEAV
jgi:hypothetical protein